MKIKFQKQYHGRGFDEGGRKSVQNALKHMKGMITFMCRRVMWTEECLSIRLYQLNTFNQPLK